MGFRGKLEFRGTIVKLSASYFRKNICLMYKFMQCIDRHPFTGFSMKCRILTPFNRFRNLIGLEFQYITLLSGVPDYFDRNKILSGYDLSHYQVPHCIKSFLLFCLICVYSSQFSILF